MDYLQPILKRRVGILRSLSRPADAISALVEFLDAFPTDAEAWCELSDLYHSQHLSGQAIFCLEEALLIVPNAWNVSFRDHWRGVGYTATDNLELASRKAWRITIYLNNRQRELRILNQNPS